MLRPGSTKVGPYEDGAIKPALALKSFLLLIALIAAAGDHPLVAQTLEQFASLPADTFAPGPTSGQFIEPVNGLRPPFERRQPVQGFSSVLAAQGGDLLVMPDNGFGAKRNSPDFVLRVYRIAPRFRTARGGSGSIRVRSFVTLRDPDRRIPFPLVADGVAYPGTDVPVDREIRRGHWLTGADFDIESVREAPDRTLWFGDEFGPFLIHTDRSGRVLEAPFALPGVQSPDNPYLRASLANLASSKGFEGLALSTDGRTLYAMLEGPLTSEPDRTRLAISAFDVTTRRFTGRQWFYRLDAAAESGQAIGDLTAVTASTFLVVERDNLAGAAAKFKKVFLIDLEQTDEHGFVIKREIADLLNLRDPANIGGQGQTFRLAFQTIESVIPLGDDRIGVLNDNNYPFGNARAPGRPDPSEFIVIRLDRPIR